MLNKLSFLQDVFVTDLIQILPWAIKWYYRVNIKKHISLINLSDNTGRLYYHSGSSGHPILFLHGLHGHPFTLLQFADALKNDGPLYSLHVTYDEHYPQLHRKLINKAINEIERRHGMPIILVGHSIGAIEAAYAAFVEKDKRISGVISIAGRLKVVSSYEKECPEHLKITIHKVYDSIEANPQITLFQIAGGKDWNSPIEATVVRTDDDSFFIIDEARHLNILYQAETEQKLIEFVRRLN